MVAVVTPAWLPPYLWASVDAADVGISALTVMVTIFVATLPARRRVVVAVAGVVTFVGILTIGWAAADLVASFERFRGIP